MTATEPIEVLEKCEWCIHWGGIAGGACDGTWGQLTKCRAGALVFYVREHVLRDHFNTSSNHRLALKRGELAGGLQILELCVPLAHHWDRALELVKANDTKGRPVRRNRQFTAAWAEDQLAKSRKRGWAY